MQSRFFRRFGRGGFAPHITNPLASRPIEYIEAPAKVEILLLQHIGPMARPLVDIGEYVRTGQLLAQTMKEGSLYSCIHASIEGIVTVIGSRILANGLKAESIVIEQEPLPNTGTPGSNIKSAAFRPWRGQGFKKILERIAVAGIVGMGGAIFPTHIKLDLSSKRRCDYLLLNAAECEPYLHSDTSLLEEMAFDVIGGIDVLADSLNPEHIVIGLEQNKAYLLPQLKAAIEHYRTHLQATEGCLPPVRVALLKARYPHGAERQLVKAISGREVAPGKLPQEVGCTIVNAATSKAIYDAVERGLPLTRRIVTLGGGAVHQSKVFSAPLGTPLSVMVERCGGLEKPVARMINGGPMMGTSFYDFQQFVTKGSSGFLFLTEKEVLRKKERPCIHCNACIHVCPMGLEPAAMYKHILLEDLDHAIGIGLMNCIECGACASSCPSQIPLAQGFRMGKARWQQHDKHQSLKG